MVLIFSSPCRSARSSKAENRSSRIRTTRSGVVVLAAPGEVDQVGEEDGDLGEAVGDDLLALLEPGRDRGREDVEQQLLGPLPLGQEQPMRPVKGPAAAHRLPQQQHRGQQRQVGDSAG